MATEIRMPSLAAGMEEATLVRWLKSEGEQVAKGEALAEIETDKAVMEMEAEADGSLGRILVPGGSEGVAVGTVIGVLLAAGEDASALEDYAAGATTAPAVQPDPTTEPATPSPEPDPTAPASAQFTAPPAAEQAARPAMPSAAPPPPARPTEGGRVFASPLARRLARQAGVELATLTGSGPRGRIVRVDVERAAAQGRATATTAPAQARAPAAPSVAEGARVERIPNSGMRKTIARRLSESKQQVPHYYLTVDCRMDTLLELRARLNARGEQAGYKLSVNDFLIFAAASALRRVQEVNSSWSEAEIIRYLDVDISVAVATDNGLITPVIREADRKGLAEIGAEVRSLIRKARQGKLSPAEYQGGGFTISNLGMFGIREFAAIINPPQAAILAVGAVEKRPLVIDDQLAVGSVMTLTLSADHRLIDGAVGARFMAELKSLLEEPETLLV